MSGIGSIKSEIYTITCINDKKNDLGKVEFGAVDDEFYKQNVISQAARRFGYNFDTISFKDKTVDVLSSDWLINTK
ncbi:MAG: hypothetical protein QM751_12970 [Paludibacteraceae bacterium]